MRKARLRAYCPHCHHQQIFVRLSINHWAHLILSILTLGLWLISWISICIGALLRPWRCEHCGWHRPEKDRPHAGPFPAGPLIPPEVELEKAELSKTTKEIPI